MKRILIISNNCDHCNEIRNYLEKVCAVEARKIENSFNLIKKYNIGFIPALIVIYDNNQIEFYLGSEEIYLYSQRFQRFLLC